MMRISSKGLVCLVLLMLVVSVSLIDLVSARLRRALV